MFTGIFKKTLMSAAVTVAAVFSVYAVYAQSEEFNTGKYLEIQSMILRTLESQYVDSVKMDELIHKGIDEMLSTLDPYTVFIPEENEEALDIMTTASYGGVGALIQKTPAGYIIIAEPYEGSAAIKAGLNPGDTIGSEYQGSACRPVQREDEGASGYGAQYDCGQGARRGYRGCGPDP